jgi:hypothetical protein
MKDKRDNKSKGKEIKREKGNRKNRKETIGGYKTGKN